MSGKLLLRAPQFPLRPSLKGLQKKGLEVLYMVDPIDESKSAADSEPLWMRQPEDVTNEEYASFYRNLSNGWEDSLAARYAMIIALPSYRDASPAAPFPCRPS